MTPCTPTPPCDAEFPLFCEPLETTNTAKAFVVEDSLYCQKRLTGEEGDIPRITSGFIKFTKSVSTSTPNSIVSRDSNGGAAFSSISGTELLLNNPIGDTRIEVGGAGNVYMDLKNPNSDDYDLRIQAVGTTPRIFTNAANLQIDGTNVNLQTNINGNVGIGTNAPSVKLDVSQAQASQTAVRVVNTNTSSAASASYLAVQGIVNADFSASENAIGMIGTSSSHPFFIKTNDINRIHITSSGNVGIGTDTPSTQLEVVGGIVSKDPTAGIGYAAGAGGTVTQGTSRTTPVTINKVCGSITMFTAAGSTTAATFTVNNSTATINNTIIVNQRSGTNLYDLLVTAVANGSFNITFRTTGGTASDAPVINFTVIKSVIV